jgi:hypothetical protein
VDGPAPWGHARRWDRAAITAVLAAAADQSLAERAWVLLTEAPHSGWGLNGHANTNDELVARAQIAQVGKAQRLGVRAEAGPDGWRLTSRLTSGIELKLADIGKAIDQPRAKHQFANGMLASSTRPPGARRTSAGADLRAQQPADDDRP